MCEPTAIIAGAGLAFSVGSQIAGHNAQEKASAANRAAALRAFREANKDIALLQQQEKEAEAVNVFDIERQARSAQAVATVSAGEAGVTGQSVRDILNDIDRERGEALDRSQQNLDDRMAMLEREKISGRTIMQQRIASVPRPNAAGLWLGIGASALGFGQTFLELQRGKASDPNKE